MGYRNYTELMKLKTFDERFEYLKLKSVVGRSTFGYDRHLNQLLYQSPRWRDVRELAIIRDYGCDLGIKGREIHGSIIVHHMNPISLEDIENDDDSIFELEGLICTILNTHNCIHFSSKDSLAKPYVERSRNDTSPWRQ